MPTLALLVSLAAGLAPFQSPAPETRPGTGLVFDLQSYRGAPYKATLTDASYTSVPSRASLETYCPTAGDQGRYGTCVAFAVAYHTRTILWGIEHRVWDDASLDSAVFSPTFLYEQIKDPTDLGCEQGTNPIRALDLMKHIGAAPLAAVPYACGGTIETEDLLAALEHTIVDYQTLFAPDEPDAKVRVRTVKKALAEDCPVVIGFTVADSFYRPSGFVWRPAPTDAGPSGAHGRHAMVVVGYQDSMDGGSFRVLNSWGPGWGDRGYIWIPYDVFASYSLCAIQVHGRKPPPLPPTPAPSPTPSPAPSPTPSPTPPVPLATFQLKGRVELAQRDGTVMPIERASAPARGETPPLVAEGLTAYRATKSYPSGTRFRFFITTNTAAYLYAFATDLTGAVTRILPFEDGMSPLVGPNSTIAFPSETKVIRMDEQPGSDFLLVLYTDRPLDVVQLHDALKSGEGGLSGRAARALGERLVPPERAGYSSAEAAFEVKELRHGQVVPLMIELRHH